MVKETPTATLEKEFLGLIKDPRIEKETKIFRREQAKALASNIYRSY